MKAKNYLLIISFTILLSCNDKPRESSTIMAILAHPDDETAVAPVLAKYAREGKKVFLVIASDGRYGVEEHAGIPAGDSLVKVRKIESINACKVLGIEEPIFLGAHDGMGIVSGIGQYFDQTISLKKKIVEQISKIQPDAIITFGPDGDTGHFDHRGISDLTTEVILREGWYDKYPLYYIGWAKEKIVSIPQGNMTSLNYVDKKYLNTKVQYTDEDRKKLFKSLNCYKSQLTDKAVQEWIDAELKDSSFVFYFRRFYIDTKQYTDL